MKQSLVFTGCVLFFALLAPAQNPPPALEPASSATSVPHPPEYQKAVRTLQKLFKKYRLKGMQIKVEQEVFLSGVQSTIKSRGILNVQGEKFLLQLKGRPSSLLLFDGQFLWYQADTSEKTVFQLKQPSRIQILAGFFNEDSFFKSFQIIKAQKTGHSHIFQIQPRTKIEGLSEVFMKAAAYISELRLIWKDLDNWQKYKFSKPVDKKFTEEMFQFTPSGFQVITRESL